jgi:hypothetical protein
MTMQHRKTTPKAPAAVRDLNARELVFVEALGQGDDNCVAYSKAYGPHNCSAATLRVNACRKAAEPQIQEHLRALRAIGFANARLTLQYRIEAELAFAQRCEDAGNYGAAGGAFDRVNKMLGLYVERSEVVVAVDPAVTLKELAAMIGEDGGDIEVRH